MLCLNFLEELHRGVCYILKDKHTGHQLKRILTSKEVRQGSVEGPACFLALFDIATWEVKMAGDREAVLAFPRGPGPVVNLSDLKFTDDLASFYEFRTLASLQQFIESVSAIFTAHCFQVNVDKLKVCVVVSGQGSRSLAK